MRLTADRTARTGALVATVGLLAAACGAAGTDGPTTGAPPASRSPVTTSPVTTSPVTTSPVGDAVPAILDFEATLVDGSAFHGADLAGGDTLFWFWAPT